ncbi:MAG: hypothetical protein A3J46_00585 [Candidatus Yanofskybacteria bacterium RIFCSPHIGHO2_02_FULL_41_11]|uniref:Glutamine amidotransferase domain-containing protein n=1 Tax=Candidatus Yanofskybacteria bacterium RIFCSPHIGHO2_02_FULL_41_11 TaxID=1802675 RepID=A0A1F8FDC9_9BACT|nr:MAG: hypothetical protein A3J46_00585 [Candidatus Yanofskybacteria bacterium RIFCSPHIGHO2_02_FULL_41_11]
MRQKNKKLKILFLDILTDDTERRKEIEEKIYGGGTYAETMRNALGLGKNQFFAYDASRGKLPNPRDYSAIISGGSVKDPVSGQEKPWMRRVYKFIRQAQKDKIPFLGICGGLQFAVRALGGEVIYNPRGRNFGNSITQLANNGKADLLFEGLPGKFVVKSSHRCIAKELKPGWKLLAFSKKSPFDAIAIGDNIRLTQFHPEMSVKQIKALAKMRKEILITEGFVTEKEFPNFMKSIKDTKKTGRKILKNFLAYFVK